MRITRCPHCGGTALDYEAGMITGVKYHCRDCHYVGPLVIEEEIPDE